MKVAVCIPIKNMMHSKFAISLVSLPSMLRAEGHEPTYHFNDMPFYDTRNNLITEALKFNPDYLLWFDTDMEFRGAELAKWIGQVINDGVDMATAMYFKRRFPDYGSVIFKQEGNRIRELLAWGTEKFECDRCGFGCVLMKADVARKVAAATGGYPFMFDGIQGEDFFFCMKARELGISIWAYPNIILGHDGIVLWHFERYREALIARRGIVLPPGEVVWSDKEVGQ